MTMTTNGMARRGALWVLAAGIAMGAPPALAQTAMGFDLGSHGITWLGSNAAVDFSTNPVLGGWRRMGDRKYLSLALLGQSPACYEIETWSVLENNRTSDTYLWIRAWDNPSWQSLNDDFKRSEHYFSRARLWLEQPAGRTGVYVEVGIAGYSNANNSMSFAYNLRLVPGVASASSCDNQIDSFALFRDGTLTVFDRVGA